MDIEDIVLVATVREDIHNHALQVNGARNELRMAMRVTANLR